MKSLWTCGLAAVLLLTLAGGCGKGPVILAPNAAQYQSSYAEVTAKMTADEKAKFDAAVAKILDASIKDYLTRINNPGEARAFALMELDGLTAREIIAKADGIK